MTVVCKDFFVSFKSFSPIFHPKDFLVWTHGGLLENLIIRNQLFLPKPYSFAAVVLFSSVSFLVCVVSMFMVVSF